MNLQLTIISSIISVALSFSAAWRLQDWRYKSQEKDRVEQQLEDQRLATKAITRRDTAVIEAQNQSAIRERGLRLDAAGSRDALVGLSDAIDSALRDAAASQAACSQRAASLGDVLKASSNSYQGLAEICDRHASDVKTLSDAWPK
jgi:hypothetical protein